MTKKQLLPGFIRRRLPLYQSIAETPLAELTVQVKFFYPDFDWTWYAIAWDGDDLFFGLVDGFEAEFGDFRLSELIATNGTLGCAIERDRYFTPQLVGPIYERARARH